MIEKLNVDVGKTRKTTERTRPRQRNHPDVEELEDDVTRVTKQWTNCIENVVDRFVCRRIVLWRMWCSC